LRGIFGGKFFASPGSREKPERALKVEAIRKGGIVHSGKLNLDSDFQQSIVSPNRCLTKRDIRRLLCP
jgi:hypothetical protein